MTGQPGRGRDRDPAGRARNARLRDAAGRPLARDAPADLAVERPPEDVALPPAAALAEAQRLLDAGRPFAAHEVLEASWKAAPARERDLWQGLAQLAVGLTHAQRGNSLGAARLLRRGAQRIAPYAGHPAYDIDVASLLDTAQRLAGQLTERPGDPLDWGAISGGTEGASAFRLQGSSSMTEVSQPVTDNSIKIRQLTHYQFSWVAGEPGQPGTYTLQLVLDQGAWEEVLTLDPDDADNLQDMLGAFSTVHYDVERRVLLFGTVAVG